MVKVMDRDKAVSEMAVSAFAPRSAWSGMAETDHFVQFYETDATLLDSLSDYIGTGLRAGDGCIVVAGEAHRAKLDERLQANGLDIGAAHACGQYVALDAAETLSRFTVDGRLDPGRFAETISGVIERAAEGRRRVRIFGNMVSHLCGQDNHEGAIHLESLWNELSKAHPFSLFCAYPMTDFGAESLGAPLKDICALHSHAIPAEGYSALTTANERLRAIVQLQQKARLLEAEVVERRQAEDSLRAVKEELEIRLQERERLLAREQLARAEAETANRLKDEFLATVSHELRTPLNAITGWSHMLRHGHLDEETQARAIETIERNAQSQAQLIEDILDVSRTITGRMRLNIESVDLATVINAAIDAVQLAADAKGIQLEVTLEPSARRVSGDVSRLQQVIWNLLSNAIKFTPAGGRVRVALERAGANAQIRVSDTGEGISADFLPFIFERFRQADGTSTRRHGGLGLGLAIVRHLVELHGGIISAESAGEGCGATFIIELPLANRRARVKERGRNNGDARAKGIAGASPARRRAPLTG